MGMTDGETLLSGILTTAQMGQTGIRSALRVSMRPSLRRALQAQLLEYDAIEHEAHAIASSRGWELRELEPASKAMANLLTRLYAKRGNSDSRIAAAMIHGSTRGMIQGLRELHQFNASDSGITILSQKLLDCETAAIRQMQGFL